MEWINETAAATDLKLGIITVQVPFIIAPQAGETKLDTLSRALTFDPAELSNFFLPKVKQEIRELEDGSYKIVFTLEGKRDPDEEGEEFSLEGTTAEDKIESHPRILEIKEKYSGVPNDDGKLIFDDTLEIDGQEVRNEMYGKESYLRPGLIWTHTFTSRRFPQDLVRALGCIDEPAKGPTHQVPPTVYAKANWMLVRARAEWRGNVWKISKSWMMSGHDGWTPILYRYE